MATKNDDGWLGVTAKQERADGQVTGLAGEFFVAGELLKRGLQTSVTFGSAKAIDLFAHNPRTGRTFVVQVKALRTRNVFLISQKRINPAHAYVFVILNAPGEAVQYYVVPGKLLAEEPERFSKWFLDPKLPGFDWKVLRDGGFENAWGLFDEP